MYSKLKCYVHDLCLLFFNHLPFISFTTLIFDIIGKVKRFIWQYNFTLSHQVCVICANECNTDSNVRMKRKENSVEIYFAYAKWWNGLWIAAQDHDQEKKKKSEKEWWSVCNTLRNTKHKTADTRIQRDWKRTRMQSQFNEEHVLSERASEWMGASASAC